MAVIRLVRGLSYMDGHIVATKEHPEVTVDDALAAHYLATGDFELAHTSSATKIDAELDEDLFIPPEDDAPEGDADADQQEETKEILEDSLAKQTVDDLKAYAEARGIDLGKATKKADIIALIVEADQKAAEARDALRQ